MHTSSVLWIYAVVCICSFIFTATTVVETKDKTPEEIAYIFDKTRKQSLLTDEPFYSAETSRAESLTIDPKS